MSAEVKVAVLPTCDLCRYVEGKITDTPDAHYDVKTIDGPWANVCENHYQTHSLAAVRGIPLGTGIGQRLVVA